MIVGRFYSGVILLALWASACRGDDWPQWGGSGGRNMVSNETGLPASFVPGDRSGSGGASASTAKNVKWVAKLGSMTCSTPVVAEGRVFIGAQQDGDGHLLCFDEATGKLLWRWSAPPRIVPTTWDGRRFFFSKYPRELGVCSTATVESRRIYFVTQRLEVLCLDWEGKTVWMRDLWELGVRPSDACNCSVLIHGDLVYACTSNGVDRDCDARKHDEFRKTPAPDAPSLVALDKKTGRVVAEDDAKIGHRLLHGQWSSPSLGKVGDRSLIFFGGGDGVCYAFEALAAVPEKPVKLRVAWTVDCNPPEYKQFGGLDPITHYVRGDRRRSDSMNRKDGTFVGMSEIIATPVFHEGRVYVAIGRDPEHGRGRGALWCIDASKTGDITTSGKVWCYQGLDRSVSTVSIAGGLCYVSDVAGRLHCVDAATGKPVWVHDTKEYTWASTLAADGKVYMPTDKFLWVLAAGKEMKVLDKIRLGGPIWASPVAANGTLYVASTRWLWAVTNP